MHRSGNRNLYLYHFTQTPSFSEYPVEGAYHTSELAFLFGHPCFITVCKDSFYFTDEEAKLSQSMMEFW